MTGLESFSENYLERWESKATVRRAARFAPTADHAESILMPEEWLRVAHDPEVAALGRPALRYLAAQVCYRMMEEIALLETDMVGASCNHVANGRHSVAVPASARQSALTISTDEAYHAFVAREFIESMSGINGIAPGGMPETSGADRALRATLATLPEELHGDFTMIALSLTENTITDEMLGLSRDTARDNPFHIVLKEHLIDEARHQAYFKQLLGYLWQAFDPEIRKRFAATIPVYIEEFLILSQQGAAAQRRHDLGQIGLSPEAVDRVIARAEATPFEKSDHPMWHNMRKALRLSGLLEDADLLTALDAADWRLN